ncbi:glycosyltransferase family 9 protein [Selenomonas ruminantium]|uniref:Lipopolysaccharide heptosyltransferase II n=1 Tax=Selenomonas ruminantium TaxID=971 RepID=A0A1H0PJQ0_SELRU|nr:glycosyltransferase family 9 protein [Selenomonas ruminantium]SDP05297.1 lipopolysaccharide heptosyltransferase II [Selenomonas ruminantium]
MKQYKNILVNALVNLGDVVLTTSAIALLKKAYPQARITMLVKPVVREAVENNPLIDEVMVFQYKAKDNSLGKMMAMVKDIKSRHFDLSISFDRKLRPALLCWLAGIPTRVGPDKVFDDKPSRVTWLYTHVMHISHNLDATLQAETYQTIIRKFTGLKDHAEPVFARITDEAEKKVENMFSQLPQAEKRIALCVKGTFELKTWPKEYFVEVVDALAEHYDAAFFIVGAPNDRAYADEVIAAMHQPVMNFCGETSLVDLAAIIRKADLLITVDTGATHIAATTGVKMVTMYGCTSPDRWHPINDNARVLTSREACCPCSVRADACPSNPKPNCLWHITPEMVKTECMALLN